MIIASTTILAVWLLLWIVFHGWGTLVCGAFRCPRKDATGLLVTPWIGIGGVVALLQVWHFAAPVNAWVFGFVCVVGLVGFALSGRDTIAGLTRTIRRHPVAAVVAALLIVWLSNRSLNSQEYNDHGAYYLNAIRWNSEYPIVLGLGNLHGPLALNNSVFLIHAMLEIGSWRDYTAHLVNGFLAALAVPVVTQGVWSIFRRQGSARQIGWFTIAIGMIVALVACDHRISSAYTDFPAGMMVTLAAWRLLVVGLDPSESKGELLRWNLVAFATLTATAFTIKLVVAFFNVFVWLALSALLWWSKRDEEHFTIGSLVRLAWPMLWIAGLLVVPWILRGYALSGCPAYPSIVGRIPVDWAVSPAAAAHARNVVHDASRSTKSTRQYARLPGFRWVPNWFVQVAVLRGPVEIVTPAVLSALSVALGMFFSRRSRQAAALSSSEVRAVWLLIAVYGMSLVVWFLTAPSPRMGVFVWWGLFGVCSGWASRWVPDDLFARWRKLVAVALVLLLLLPTMVESLLIETRYQFRPKMAEFGHHFYEYHPFVLPMGEGGFPPLPTATLQQRATRSGLVVYVPTKDEQGRVWDAPLPATNSFNPDLALRNPDDMASGFKIVPPPEVDAQ